MSFDIEDLLIDDDNLQKNIPSKKTIINKPKETILNTGYARPIDLDKSTSSEKDSKIIVQPQIQIKKKVVEEIPPPQNNNNNNIAAFVLGQTANLNINANTNSNINVNSNINEKRNSSIKLNEQKPIQIKSNPSSFSGQSLGQISKTNVIINSNNSSINQNIIPPPQINININERKEYEDKIKEYKNQKEQIITVYSYDIERKNQEIKEMELKNQQEIEKLDKKYEDELRDIDKYYNEKIERYENQKKKLEEERLTKLKQLKDSQENFFQQQIEMKINQFNSDKEHMELDHKFKLEQIELELEQLKHNKNKMIIDEISNRKIDDIYNDLYKKISSKNNDIELNIELKKKNYYKRI